MFNEIPYKKKVIGLLLIFILLAIVSYKKSFIVTYQTNKSITKINEKLVLINSSNENIKYLSEKMNALDNLIGKQVEPELVQHFLIDFISQFKKIQIVHLEETHTFSDDSFNIYTNQIVLQGGYNDLIKTIYQIEKQFKTSRIIGVNFYTKQDYNLKKQQLFVKLIFQNYEKNV